MNRQLVIDILIVCIMSILGIILIRAQIVGATGLQKYFLVRFCLYLRYVLFRCKHKVGGIVFHKHIF